MKKVAVILSGCGYLDGSEIHESVMCLLALSQAGAEAKCFAPDGLDFDVVDHKTARPTGEKRDLITESARIARGDITALSKLNVSDFDALLLPGGFGAAKNLSDFASKGPSCSVLPGVDRVIHDFYDAGKPIGALCISPAVVAGTLRGKVHATMTLGSDPANQSSLNEMEMQGELANANDMIADDENRIYTTPCYMEKAGLKDMFVGVKQVVDKLLA